MDYERFLEILQNIHKEDSETIRKAYYYAREGIARKEITGLIARTCLTNLQDELHNRGEKF